MAVYVPAGTGILSRLGESMNEKNLQGASLMAWARRRKGYSQQMVANRTGIDRRLYQRLEHGERDIGRVSMKTGLSICKALDIDPFQLVPDHESPHRL